MMQDANIAKLIRFTESKIICTGGVVFVGDGNTGKTHTAMSITEFKGKSFFNLSDATLKKSVNLEWDYFIFQSNIEEYLVRTSSQIFIMPGQKGRAKLGEGLAFEDAADLYFHVAPIKVVLSLILTFDLTDIKTFLELEYWLVRAIERDMVQPYTSIIILGTHLDQEGRMVTDENMQVAKTFVRDLILEKTGLDLKLEDIHTIKVSNLSGDGITDLKSAINHSFLSAFNLNDYITFQKENNNHDESEKSPSSDLE
ncbi:MAG: Rab family GTPase [Candidatus Heimdallarchaeota archaeon]